MFLVCARQGAGCGDAILLFQAVIASVATCFARDRSDAAEAERRARKLSHMSFLAALLVVALEVRVVRVEEATVGEGALSAAALLVMVVRRTGSRST